MEMEKGKQSSWKGDLRMERTQEEKSLK